MQARRVFLKAAAALAAAGVSTRPWFALSAPVTDLRVIGAAKAFDYTWLKGQARAMAAAPYREANTNLPEAVRRLDWDQYQALRYRDDHALWAKDGLRFQVEFFHLGLFYHHPVHMFEVVNGQARELAYDKAMFDYGKSGLRDEELPADLGFAGFRVNYHTDLQRDVAAFLGASYFRAVGGEMQYGLSARGLAIDTGMDRPEEFPRFVAFWFERPAAESGKLTVYALLDSPSAAGAYRFDIHPAPTLVMDVDAAVYPRRPIERLGIAALTSMYQHGENDRRMANDWRPEIHDSDGLSLWTGRGEWIWRPIANPPVRHFNVYLDDNPRGFGLMQRDRNFDHYQDDGVFYDRRPSAWVEPKAAWGKGSVQLLELPTADETFDNIVAFWNPAKKPEPGEELAFGYRLYWGSRMPFESPLGKVIATRTGIGGVVGRPRTYFSWRFVIDFAGGELAMLGKDAKVEPVITASRGKVEIAAARPLAPVQGYRASFDLRPPDDSTAPIDIRVFLRTEGRALTETWIYQWLPPPADQRKL